MMSGAAVDGISLALVSTDGENIVERGPARFFPYSRDLKVFIRRAVRAAQEGRDGSADIAKASGEITQAHAIAVGEFLASENIKRTAIDVIGFHGHTILHRPRKNPETAGRSWQIGDGGTLAEETGIDVVAGFHDADISQGGEGAPLDAVYYAALVRELEPDGAVCVVNFDEQGKVCFIPHGGGDLDVVCFDCGPGLGLLERWMEMKTGERPADLAAIARAGKVHSEVLRLMLLNPYLRRKPPKALDRVEFKLDPLLQMSAADGAATLTALAAACVRANVALLPEKPRDWIVTGEGRRNSALLEAVGKALDGEVHKADSLGWRGDAIEAESVAYLAVRALRRLPFTFPRTTRAPRPLSGGTLWRAPV